MFVLPPEKTWRPPSQAQRKDALGNENKTIFRLTARLNDGYIIWRGWFQDRDDADAFLYSLITGSLIQDRSLWRLPSPQWHPDLGENLQYDFATVTFLTASPGSNQSWSVPSDWNSSNNFVECLAGGAGGGAGNVAAAPGAGGGGGSYSKVTNVTLTPSGTATYNIGSGALGGQTNGSTGTAGGDTYFNGATGAGASVWAKGAAGGVSGSGGAGGAGGVVGTGSGFSGGAGGNGSSTSNGGGGGGGAAGLNGAGNAGSPGVSTTGGNGGSADNGSGGAGGSAGTTPTAGGNGTEWDATHGSGGGGGGLTNAGSAKGADGGNYGGGGGGGGSSGQKGGNGIQGMIVTTYTPAASSSVFSTNLSMIGM